ncbi:MAG: hypothetical protein LRZ98_00135 [Candidatus Pacebacteria bacterium]|nr:hypothetical protein [Candidatus Paceibacterota bacterium]
MFGIGDAAKKIKNKAKALAMKKMMEKEMKNLSPQQKELVMNMLAENPKFFEDIAKEIDEEVKSGKSQMVASMTVMKKHQAKMQELMMRSAGGNPKMTNRNLH